MAFSSTPTYAELKTAIANWAKRADLSTYLDDVILMGEKWVFRNARTRDMETALNLSISSGVAAIPTDYVEMKHSYIDGTPVQSLQMRPASWIYIQYPTRSAEGKPVYIGTEGSNFIFGPYADSSYTLKGIYYKRLTSVASSANALFTANPDLYLFAALAELEPFLKNDKRIGLWTAKRAEILAQVNGEDNDGNYGGLLTVRAA